MGRMLEAFSQGSRKQEQPLAAANLQVKPEPPPEARPSLRDECPKAELVPYIEVGGPKSVIDASPDVLAATPKPRANPSSEKSSTSDAESKPAFSPEETAATIAIWCSWTLRGGAREQST